MSPAILSVVYLVLVIGCGHGDSPMTWPNVFRTIHDEFPNVRNISTEDLAAWQADDERPPPILLDVRETKEYAVSHLPTALRVDPSNPIRDKDDAKPWDRDATIVVYCSVGYRSSRAAGLLTEAGYQNVFNLKGSIFQWANEGRVVVRNGKPVHEVHPYDGRWGLLLDSSYHPVK